MGVNMPDKNIKFDKFKSKTTNRFTSPGDHLNTEQLESRLRSVKPLMIDDKQIMEKIQKYMKEQNQENFNDLMNSLPGIEVIVPSVVGKDGLARPVFLRDGGGQPWLPAYTTYGRLPQGDNAPKSQALTKVPFMVADEMSVSAKCAGMILNPFTDNLFIKSELAQKIIRVEEDKKKRATEQKKAAEAMAKADAAEAARQQQIADEDAEDMAAGRGDEVVADIQVTDAQGKTRVLHLTEQQYDVFMRQQVDFTILPRKFFADGQAFVDDLSENGVKAIDAFYEDAYDLKRMYPYVLDDFDVMALDINEDLTVVQIEMPRRNLVIPCAIRVYLAWQPKEQTGRYFAVEITQNQDVMMLSEIVPQGKGIFKKHILNENIVESAELQSVVDLMDRDKKNSDDAENA